MKQQIATRLGVAHVRDTMMQFATGSITRFQAVESLQVGQSQLYALKSSYLAARAIGRGDDWVRRWQRKAIGELWQPDATPDRFLGKDWPLLNLIDMFDDCSRMQVGCRLCYRETVQSYLDLFYGAFNR